MGLIRRLMCLVLLAIVATGCDVGPSNLNIDNQTDASYVARIDTDQYVVIPPRRHVTAHALGMVRNWVPLRLFDAACHVLGEWPQDPGTLVIDASGQFPFRRNDPGSADAAEFTRFCADVVPGASGSPDG